MACGDDLISDPYLRAAAERGAELPPEPPEERGQRPPEADLDDDQYGDDDDWFGDEDDDFDPDGDEGDDRPPLPGLATRPLVAYP